MFSYENKKCAEKIDISPLYCLLVHQTSKWQIYTSVIAPLLGPGGYPTVFWGVVVFHVHLMWTREQHIPLLATKPHLHSLLANPVLPLVVEWEKKEKLTDKMQEMFCYFPHQLVWQKVFFFLNEQNLWKLSPDFTPGMMELINLPGQDHVLTTGSVLSQWDL